MKLHARKKIVLIAGNPSHGPGAHEYEKTVKLLKVLLEQSRYGTMLEVAYVLGGWPANDNMLEDADLVLFATDGRDGDLYEDVPFVTDERRMALMARLMDRGCGLVLLHFSTFFTREEGRHILEWAGGYFEWQDESGERNWYSQIAGDGSALKLADKRHPVARGVADSIELNDEIYWKMRLLPDDPRRTPIWTVPELQREGEQAGLVGWTIDREGGGRSFVTTAGHRFTLWEDDSFRKLHLNAILWAAGFDIPEGGVHSRHYKHDAVESLLRGELGTVGIADKAGAGGKDGKVGLTVVSQTAAAESDTAVAGASRPLHALLVSGNAAHKWHNWERTEPLIREILHEDASTAVTSVFDTDALDRWDLSAFDVILLNYCNWHDPAGLSERAKSNMIRYMEQGGGLVVLHFANGAFHYSLPEAGGSDWPEYRRIVPRVWDHHGGRSGHDAYGTFGVSIVDREHAVTRGIGDFTVTDELYYGQEGDSEIHVLCSARSIDTGKDEPLAWTSAYKNGRVFQTLLGHDDNAYRVPEVREMLQRAVMWAARRL